MLLLRRGRRYLLLLKTAQLILLWLTQLAGCVGHFCSLPIADAFESQRVSPASHSIVDVATIGADDFISVEEKPENADVHFVKRIRGGYEETLVETPLTRWSMGERVFSKRAGEWWYSRHSRLQKRSRILFVTGKGAAITEKTVEPSREKPLIWLPLDGDDPAGVLISLGASPTFHADVVTPSGMTALGEFEGHLPGSLPTPWHWSAKRLADGRITLVSSEKPFGGSWSLMLRVFGAGDPVESVLPCGYAIANSLAVAVASGGSLVIAGLSLQHEVVAMSVDVDAPDAGRCRILTAPGESAVAVSLLRADDSTIAAWIREDRTVAACVLRGGAAAPPVIDVGEDAALTLPLVRLAAAEDETVQFSWKDRSGAIVTRRLPRSLPGFALLAGIHDRLCRGTLY